MTFTQILPSVHGKNDGTLKLHSHDVGVESSLQVSALLKQSDRSKQEHGGCPVTLIHTLPGSHMSILGPLEEHWHKPAVVLQVFPSGEQGSGEQ